VSLEEGQMYCYIASLAVLLYDILITNDREIASIWKRKFSIVAFLFFNMRYATLLCQVAFMVNGVQPGAYLPCKAASFIFYSTTIWARTAFACFGAFRTWAIWGRHWIPLVLILPISLLPVALDLYQVTRLHTFAVPGSPPLSGCNISVSLPIETQIRFGTITRASAIASDVLILAVTWIKTWSIHRDLKLANINSGKLNVSLSGLLLRDGTIYFAVLLCINISCLVLDTTPKVVLNPVSSFIDSIVAILLCRLILNLRSFDMDNTSISTTKTRHVTSIQFAHAVLDNIGASVYTGGSDNLESMCSTRYGDRKDATLEKIVNDPLVIGLVEDIYHTEKRPSNEEGLEDSGV